MITEKERRFELLNRYMPKNMALTRAEDEGWEFLINCFGSEEKFIEEMEEQDRKLMETINAVQTIKVERDRLHKISTGA